MAKPSDTTSLTILSTAIRQDAAGRFCLNDCHRASGSEPTKRPGEWLRNDQTRELIAELETAGISAVKTTEGRNGGTYVAKELVYAYAMWISPAFHLQVIRAFDTLVQLSQPHVTVDTLDPATLKMIGGVVKSILTKQMRGALDQLLPPIIDQRIAADPRVGVGEYISSLELLEEAKVPARGRRKINARLGSALRSAIAQDREHIAKRCPRTGTWLFPVAFARRFMASEGKVLVAEHMDMLRKQTGMRLVDANGQRISNRPPFAADLEKQLRPDGEGASA